MSKKKIASAMLTESVNLRSGALYIGDTASHDGEFGAIQALSAAVVTFTSEDIQPIGAIASVPIPAGTTIYGSFTNITAASGKLLAYYKP